MYWRGLYFLLATMIFIDAYATENPYQPHLLDVEQNNVNYGYLLELGDDALLARIHLIRNARETIVIQTFIWAPDESGTFVFYELLEAARRGVKVRLLVDDLSIRAIPKYVAYLATLHPNLEIKQFNPVADNIEIGRVQTVGKVTTNFTGFNSRMHNKIVVVDGMYGITGGRNYANDYFDRGTGRSFLDRDVLVIGPAVEDMSVSFEEYWASNLVVYSTDMKDVRKQVDADAVEVPDIAKGYAIPEMLIDLSDCAATPECVDSRIVSRGIQLDHVQFVADHPGKHDDGDDYAETTESIIELTRNAKQSIIFQTPYLVAGGSANKFFKGIIKDNPEIEFVVSTNSLAAADHFYAYAFSYKNKKSTSANSGGRFMR